MVSREGSRVWAARLNAGQGGDNYIQYTIGPRMGDAGGSGSVHAIVERMRPPLVVKLYDENQRKRIRANTKIGQRIVVMALNRDHLASTLPWAMWPRRIVFSEKDPNNAAHSLLGFSMQRLDDTVSLDDLLKKDSVRIRLTPAHTAHLALTLCDRFNTLHKHPWGFVFGDVSPSNIRVTRDLSQVYFIDTDAFSYTYQKASVDFPILGFTPSYNSPESIAQGKGGPRVTTKHDSFVLAILIFQLLLADKGIVTHPFQSGGHAEDDLIAVQAFPLDNLVAYPVHDLIVAAYRSLPVPLQRSFSQTFAGPQPVTPLEWIPLLQAYRRSL